MLATAMATQSSSQPRRPSSENIVGTISGSSNPTTKSASASDKPDAASSTVADSTCVTKPKQSKSRNGCVTCKAKRLKCDEIKPTCQQCAKRGVECGGYKKDFKWRPFEDNLTAFKPITVKAVKVKPQVPKISPPIPTSKRKRAPSDAPSSPTKSEASPSLSPVLPSPSADNHSSAYYISNKAARLSTHNPSILEDDQPCQVLYNESTITDVQIQPIEENFYIPSRASISPQLQDLLLPGSDLNRQAPLPELLDYQPLVEEVLQTPPGLYTLNEDVEDIEEIDRSTLDFLSAPGSDWQIVPNSPIPHLAVNSPNTAYTSLMTIFRRPSVHVYHPEILMSHFDKHTCGIMSVKDGPNENPWRTLIWPLAKDVPALYHAVSSMTAFHMSRQRPDLRLMGMEHMRQSIRNLAGGLGTTMTPEAALATTLALAFAESWDRHISTGIQHLRGAKILVNQALMRHRSKALHGEPLQRLRFLYNVFVYLDVLARLTSDNDDDCLLPEPACNLSPSSAVAEIDPLMGCATTLFPLIGQCATLVRQVRSSPKNTIRIIAQALELKQKIEQWKTESYFEPPEDPSADVTACTRTAEAYRWATLLYLHQAVPEIASQTSHELAEKVLRLLASIPTSSRTCIVHIYPLLAAGCEALGTDEREWVTNRWRALEERMWLGNVDRAWEVIQEVWKRRDEYQAAREAAENAANAQAITVSFSFSQDEAETPTFDPSDEFLNLLQAGSPQDLGEGYGWEAPSAQASVRRSTFAEVVIDPLTMSPSMARKPVVDEFGIGEPEYEMTIRGRLHWVGVMKDWQWEVLLG